jgi:hypothetical protein
VIDEDRLVGEVFTLGVRFGWSLTEILDLEHPLRERFVREAARLASDTSGEA